MVSDLFGKLQLSRRQATLEAAFSNIDCFSFFLEIERLVYYWPVIRRKIPYIGRSFGGHSVHL